MNATRIPTGILAFLLMATAPHSANAQNEPAAEATTKTPVRVLVAYYSLTDNTEKMAGAVVDGAKRVPNVSVQMKKVDEVSAQDLEQADGIVLGCPTYFGGVPGKMKTVIDDWNWKLKVDFTDKVGGAFSTGGGRVGGKESVVLSLLIFMIQNRMVVAGPLYRNEKTGSVWGELGASAMTGPIDSGVGEAEMDGARRLGERVAEVAGKYRSEQRTAGTRTPSK